MTLPRCLNRHLLIPFYAPKCDAIRSCTVSNEGMSYFYGRAVLHPRPITARRHASTISARVAKSNVGDPLPEGIKVYEAEPVTVQKSIFVGRACRLDDPSHVIDILAWIMQQKGVAKAAHPIIYAWRCKVNGLMQQGDDDDGEWAAGDRLARLLELVKGENVLVIVTRYFGGVKLGPSRFKYISQAARSALDAGKLLEERPEKGIQRPSKHRR